MVYCGKCGLPPEYCEFAGKASDLDECKKWLEVNSPALFLEIYPPVEVVEGEESKE
jgi:hypothetical protein